MRTTMAVLFLVLLVARSAAGQSAEDRYFDSGGVRIRYVDVGAGEPVLLVHGFTANLDVNWVRTGVVAALAAAGYRVIAYDDRGHGRSGKPHDPAAYGDPEVEDAVRLLDHLGIGSAHVVGYSRGGVLALQLAALHPDRVRTLVVGDSPGLARRVRLLAVPGLVDSLEAGRPGPMLRALAPTGAPPRGADSLNALFLQALSANDFVALAAVLRAPPFSALDTDDVAASGIPVLILVGELDPVKPAALSLARALAGADTVVIPGATHLSAVVDPAFAAAVLQFLGRHAAAPGMRPGPHPRRWRTPRRS